MRILPGPPQGYANETTTSNHLIRHAVNMPTFLAKVPALHPEETPFTSLLSKRGNIFGSNDWTKVAEKGYKQVGSKEVRWSIKGSNKRLMNIVRDSVCEEYPDEPGKNQSVIHMYLDTNWASPRDVCELADNRTLLWNYVDDLPREVEAGVWHYKFKLVTGVREESVDPALLRVGQDMGVAYNMYEELSQTASIWIEHNGVPMWITHQELEMMKRWAEYREYQLIFGKGTVSETGKTIATLENSNIEVTAGDGLLNQGDGIWKMPYQKLTTSVLESMMNNLMVSSSYRHQDTAVAVVCGRSYYNAFIKIMKDVAGHDPKVVVQTKGGGKAIDMDYEYYKWSGVKFFPIPWKFFDDINRPGRRYTDQLGNRLESHRAIFVSLGDIAPDQPAVELLALGDRQFKKGSVYGINRGGEGMSNSIDGEHTHILSETGIANRDLDGIAEMYIPVVNNSRFFISRS